MTRRYIHLLCTHIYIHIHIDAHIDIDMGYAVGRVTEPGIMVSIYDVTI